MLFLGGWNLGCDGGDGGSGGKTIDMRCWWWRECEKLFYLLERDGFAFALINSTVCMPRIREPELEEFVGQGKWQEVERA